MRLEGKLMQGTRILGIADKPIEEAGSQSFSNALDDALLTLCKSMNVPIPLWMKKNTREFAHFHQTVFFPGQFTETVYFSEFQIRLID